MCDCWNFTSLNSMNKYSIDQWPLFYNSANNSQNARIRKSTKYRDINWQTTECIENEKANNIVYYNTHLRMGNGKLKRNSPEN